MGKIKAMKTAEDEAFEELERAEMWRKRQIEERMAQPEQEPVACVQDLDEVKRKHLVYEKGMDWKDPLYTTPPQRTWVGLTDEQKLSLEIQGGKADVMLAELVEQWLKEKNT